MSIMATYWSGSTTINEIEPFWPRRITAQTNTYFEDLDKLYNLKEVKNLRNVGTQSRLRKFYILPEVDHMTIQSHVKAFIT